MRYNLFCSPERKGPDLLRREARVILSRCNYHAQTASCQDRNMHAYASGVALFGREREGEAGIESADLTGDGRSGPPLTRALANAWLLRPRRLQALFVHQKTLEGAPG